MCQNLCCALKDQQPQSHNWYPCLQHLYLLCCVAPVGKQQDVVQTDAKESGFGIVCGTGVGYGGRVGLTVSQQDTTAEKTDF